MDLYPLLSLCLADGYGVTPESVWSAWSFAPQAVLPLLAALADRDLERSALGEYHRRRDELSSALFEVSDEIASYAWDIPTAQRLLRRLSAAMSDELELLAALPSHGIVDDSPAGATLA